MQFKTIGEIVSLVGKNGSHNITQVATALQGLSRESQVSMMSLTALTQGEKLAILQMNDLNLSANKAALNAGKAATRTTSLFTNLGNAIKGFVVSNQLLTVFLAGAAALFAVNALVDKFTTTFDESFEAAQKSAEEYNNTVSEISSLNSELETTNARIDELNAKEHLSFVEQSELNKLYATREQLEKVIALKEKQAEAQGKDSAEDSKTTLEKKDFNVRSKDNQGNYVKDANGNYVYEKGTVLEDALDTMDKLNSAQEKLNKLKEEGADEDSSEYKFASENVDTLTAHLTENMDKINELSTHLYNTETGEALKGYEDLARGVNDVIDVYLDFSDTGSSIDHKIENIFAKAKFKDVKDSLVEAGKEGSNALNNMISSTPGLTDALNAAGVSAQQLSEYIMALADPEALNLDIIKKQLKDIYSSDNYKLNLKAGEKASKEFDEFLNKKKPEEIEIFYRYVKQNDLDISGWTLEDLQYNFDKAVNNEAVSSIDSLTDSSNEFLASVNAVNEALSAQSTGESIDSETYNSEELKTYASALEYVNGSMQLNAEKVRELTKAKAEEKIAILEASKANDINEYNENAAKIAFYMSNLKNLTGAERAELNSLQSRNSIIAANSIQYDIMTASIREATGAYKEWLNAQNTPESGDMADDARSAMEKISEVFDSSSKEYGRVGTTKYQAAVDFVVPDEVSAEGDKAVREYVKNLQTYFTEDKSGSDKFIQEALDKGLMEYDPDTGATKVAANKTMEDFAKSFNWTDETTKAMFGELQEYGWDFNWSDESIKNYDEALFACNETAVTLQSRIDELNGKKVKTEADLTELEQLKKELAEIEAEKQRINSTKLNTFADLSSELGEAKRELSALYEKKDRHLPVDDSEIENAKQKVTDLESEINELGSAPTKVQIEAEVELVDKQLEEKKQELNKAQIRQTVTAETDTSGLQNEVAKLEQQKRNLEYTLTVVPDTDEAESKLNELNNTEFNPKSITVDVIGDAQTKLNSIKSALALLPTEKEISITTTYTQNGTPPQTGDQTVNGTANANGNFNATAWASSYTGLAYANGNWASQKSGTTLIGELGREIVVHYLPPYTVMCMKNII